MGPLHPMDTDLGTQSGQPQKCPPETVKIDPLAPSFSTSKTVKIDPPGTLIFDLGNRQNRPLKTSKIGRNRGSPGGVPAVENEGPGGAPPRENFPKFAKFRPRRGGVPRAREKVQKVPILQKNAIFMLSIDLTKIGLFRHFHIIWRIPEKPEISRKFAIFHAKIVPKFGRPRKSGAGPPSPGFRKIPKKSGTPPVPEK